VREPLEPVEFMLRAGLGAGQDFDEAQKFLFCHDDEQR
jgi:hypothetical protein